MAFPATSVDGGPWFDLDEACQILEIGDDAIENLSPDGIYRIGSKTFINERNLNKLIALSDKPEAIAYMNQVCDELVSIRKDGYYASPGTSPLDIAKQML